MNRKTVIGDVRIILTDGNIKNNYLRVRQFGGLVENEDGCAEQRITLELEGSAEVSTEIDWKKGILREREALKVFFGQHGLKEGNVLLVEKLEDGHFAIRVDDNEKSLGGDGSLVSDANCLDSLRKKDQLLLFGDKEKQNGGRRALTRRTTRRANELDGREWTAYSVSIWKDIKKGREERQLAHPAMFPIMLVEKVVRCFTTSDDKVVLDPFMGSGSTLVASCLMGKKGIGFEIYEDYVQLAKQRLAVWSQSIEGTAGYDIHSCDASRVGDILAPNSVDLCFTSPPYWNILARRRTADNKETRNYGTADLDVDLSRIEDYSAFIEALGRIFANVLTVLRPGKYCVVNVMDIRKRSHFFPFHADLAKEMEDRGFIFDDIVIWDRSHEYNNLRPLGYPAVFRINKVHEYLLIFQKPKESRKGRGEKEKG